MSAFISRALYLTGCSVSSCVTRACFQGCFLWWSAEAFSVTLRSAPQPSPWVLKPQITRLGWGLFAHVLPLVLSGRYPIWFITPVLQCEAESIRPAVTACYCPNSTALVGAGWGGVCMSFDTQQWRLGVKLIPPTLLLHVLSVWLMTCCTFIFSDLVMTTRIPDDKHGTVVSSSEWSLCLWRGLLLSHNLCGRSEDGELSHSHVITVGAEIHNETMGIQALARCIFSQGMLHVEDFHPCMTQAKLKDGLGLCTSLFIFPLDITSRCASTEKR